MAIEIPAAVNLLACGPTHHYFAPDFPHVEKFTLSINNSHVNKRGFKPDLICAMDDLERDQSERYLPSWPSGLEVEEDHSGRYVKDIVEAGCPVLTTAHKPQWPTTEAYPLQEVVDWLNIPPYLACHILTNTINYSLAYLGYKGAKTIRLFGVDFTRHDEKSIVSRQINFLDRNKWPDWTVYYMEALIRTPVEPGMDGCLWLMGNLNGRGIEVCLPVTPDEQQFQSTTLLDMDRPRFFYGYQEQPDVV